MRRRRYDPDDMPVGVCSSCGDACTGVVVDFGIGPYEYWGSCGCHVDEQIVSPCCEADIVPGGEKVIRCAEHTARRDHKDGKVKKGDRYRVVVTFHWRGQGGPGWITEEKRVIDAFKSAVKIALAS